MGWRGTLRTMNAIARESERASRRRQRELERQQVYLNKMAAVEQAQHAIEAYNNILERLTSIHKECSKVVDWQAIASEPAPDKPIYDGSQKLKAEQNWNNYKPAILDKLFKTVEKKKIGLHKNIAYADEKDKATYKKMCDQFNLEFSEWENETNLAKSVLANDPKSYLKAIEEISPFEEISNLGTGLEMQVFDDGLIKATLGVHGDSLLPKESYSLLKSGKLSIKPVPKSQFYPLYQDYVCGCVLRVANELFSILPINMLIVSAKDKLLDPATGHLEDQPILSVLIPRATFQNLNMDSLDPSESMKNFVHNMDFKKTAGFGPVEEVSNPTSKI